MPIIEPSKIGGVREDGSTIILPEVETRIVNAKTAVEYDDDDAADADVNDPQTETTAEDIQRHVAIRVLKGVNAAGDAGV